MSDELATLGGGCFWCIEGAFQHIKGIQQATSGYAGGATPNPTYRDVCTGRTGHAEVVQLVYDSDIIDFKSILRLFFTMHDPTTVNRQGNDIGTQYRSIVMCHTEEQKTQAEDLIQELEQANTFDHPIVTEIKPLDTFYPAEEHHQNFFAKNPEQPYCQAIISPKLSKLRQLNQQWFKN